MRIAFDIGGVLSKFPDVFRPMIDLLLFRGVDSRYGIETYVISDMHDHAKMVKMLHDNGFNLSPENIHSADYATHGEECKAVLCEQLGIDVLIDDFPGYVASVGRPLVRLLVMPDPRLDYYAADWTTTGEEGNFGRRKNPMKNSGGVTGP